MKKKPIELHPVINRTGLAEFFRTLWFGKAPQLVGKPAITGHLTNSATKRKVTMRLNEILNIADIIKIGVSGDTDARMDKDDYRGSWEYVSRVYKTTSIERAKDYEVELIKKFKKSHPNQITNISETRAGRLTTYNGFYYIYVVFNVDE